MQKANPYHPSPVHEGRAGSLRSRWHLPLLLAWGIIPTILSLRSIYYAMENYRVHGRFYFGLIRDGYFEYVTLATWIICVLLYGNNRTVVRLVRSVSIIPAFVMVLIAMVSIVRQLLPGGPFYMPSVISRNGVAEFLMYHSIYAILLVPMAGYSYMVFRDEYRLQRYANSQHP